MTFLSIAFVALAGQVFDEPVGLDEVLSPAVAAVVVRLDTPASVPVAIPVPGAVGKDCGTYAFGVWRGVVDEVVLAPPAPLSLPQGAPLNVYFANTPDLIGLTRDACLRGGSKSPIFQSFAGESPRDGARLLVVLRWEPPYGWVETVSGSWLLPSAAAKVKEKLAARTWSPSFSTGELLCVKDADCGEKRACKEMRCR